MEARALVSAIEHEVRRVDICVAAVADLAAKVDALEEKMCNVIKNLDTYNHCQLTKARAFVANSQQSVPDACSNGEAST